MGATGLRPSAPKLAATPLRLSNRGSHLHLPETEEEKGPREGALSLLLAGGEGFEPPLAESESAVLPLDDPPKRIVKTRLAFRELGCATCFTQTDFLALYFT